MVNELDKKSYNSKSPKEDLEEPCMLFRSPPRTLNSEHEDDESPFKKDSFCNSDSNMLQDRLEYNKTNSFNPIHNMN